MEEKWETLKLEKSVLSEWEAQRGTADRETGRGCNLGMYVCELQPAWTGLFY